MPTKILGRPWQWWIAAPMQSAHYAGISNAFRIYRRPIRKLVRYVFHVGDYPYRCRLRTPLGEVSAELHSWHDMLTIHEVFCRLDYRVPSTVQTVVDIGSNIGVSALYFLSRNTTCRCYLVEPDPKNIARLRKNLEPFSARYSLHECAVSDTGGMVEFGTENTGRYGGIERDLADKIVVPCREINELLEEVLAETDSIDVLKIDTEGIEELTVRAIRPELLSQIRLIYLESVEPLPALHPEYLVQSRRLMTVRLISKPTSYPDGGTAASATDKGH